MRLAIREKIRADERITLKEARDAADGRTTK